jgi:hypothetical protein
MLIQTNFDKSANGVFPDVIDVSDDDDSSSDGQAQQPELPLRACHAHLTCPLAIPIPIHLGIVLG